MSERRFKLLKQYNPSEPIAKACSEVADLCNRLDNTTHTFFLEDNFQLPHTLPWVYCAVNQDDIAGFISVYKIDSTNIEICGFVLPRYRRCKVFTKLLKKMCEDYEDYTIQTCVYSHNSLGKSVLKSVGFDYLVTECLLEISLEDFFPLAKASGVSWNLQKNAVIFTYTVDGQNIGSCYASINKKDVVIHDVKIIPEYQNQGYGYKLMCYALDNLLKAYSSVTLHVTKENVAAYKLYKKLGFKPIQELEYYEY